MNFLLYFLDDIGLHRVENPSFTDKAVSLHLYSPPFTECASFDQRTGHKNMCKVTFYSRAGKRTPFGKWQKQPTVTFHPTSLVSCDILYICGMLLVRKICEIWDQSIWTCMGPCFEFIWHFVYKQMVAKKRQMT